MAAADPQQTATDAYGRARDEFDDPVIVLKAAKSRGRVHEPADDGARPQCHHGSRDDVEWRFEERASAERYLDDCSVCEGTTGPNDQAGELKECPFCGDDVKAVRWPDHIRGCSA